MQPNIQKILKIKFKLKSKVFLLGIILENINERQHNLKDVC